MGRSAIATVLVLLLASCTSIAARDNVAIENATDLKVEVRNLMAKSTEPATQHEQAITFVLLRAEQALEYAKTKQNNDETIRQYEILLDPNRSLLGGYLGLWRGSESGMSEEFSSAVNENIQDALDEIVRLERAKNE